MQELYTIIQNIMKYNKSGERVSVTLKDDTILTGVITDFTGETFVLGDSIISTDNIALIEEIKTPDLSSFYMKRVEIILLNSMQIDAVLVSSDGKNISCITEDGQKTIDSEQIEYIKCAEEVIPISDKGIQGIDTQLCDKEQDSIETDEARDISGTGSGSVEKKPEDKTVEGDDEGQKEYKPNTFEEGLINGDKATVGKYVSKNQLLIDLGYSEKEITRIKKAYKNTSWEKDPYTAATRINQFQVNKNGLARKYYEEALGEADKGSKEYVKVLNVLSQLIYEDSSSEYITFWKSNAKHLKGNVSFCNSYISALIKERGVDVNPFETALINGEKQSVISYVQNDSELLGLGYTAEDIERIKKALKSSNWETSWYKTATRLFGMQLNRDYLAEIYYGAALVVANKKGEEYVKILNALASIKTGQDNESYIEFFSTYSGKLKTNASFCMRYANALLATQKWKKLEKEMPMLKEQLASNPGFIDGLEREIAYYKSLPPFRIDNFPVLANRQKEEGMYEQEASLIDRLPDRNAIKTLLDIYSFNKEEDAYFELMRYALFFTREEKAIMAKLQIILKETEKSEEFVYFMGKIPVFWCNDDLIKKYIDIKETGTIENIEWNERLIDHIKSIQRYNAANSFEDGIINRDYEVVKKYATNPALLEELGYSESEIEDIQAIDIDEQLAGDYYTMRRLLAFQGNKNHIAEQYIFEAFYSNKLDMCNRLFPLLLEEKRGELILSLFQFDHDLSIKMNSLHRYYCLALCIAEKNDEIFYDHMQSIWADYPDDIVLDRMLRIAEEKKDELLVKQIEIQKNRPRGNEFETALIEADTDTVRKYVKSADLLVELGYTPEEIKKISKIFSLGGTNNSSKPGQIANRVYLYQKNKNNLAERLFLNAITEDSPEDVRTDCKALYQIYVGQHNYEMVCKIYEDYLHLEMEEKFNAAYASNYCVALFELQRYKEFLDYYIEYNKKWDNFTLYANLLYVCEVLNVHDYDDLIWNNLNSNLYRADIIGKYIKYVLQVDSSRIYSDEIINLINMFFVRISNEEISDIKMALRGLSTSTVVLPKGGIIVALMLDSGRGSYIAQWYDYMSEQSDDNSKIDLLTKLAAVFEDDLRTIVNKAIVTYQRINQSDDTGYRVQVLEELISQNIRETEEEAKWCEIQADILRKGKGGITSLRHFLSLSEAYKDDVDFWEVYQYFKKSNESEISSEALFDIILSYYDKNRGEMKTEKKKEVVLELIELSGDISLDYIGCKNMSRICAECGMDFESKMFLMSSNRAVGQNTGDTDDENNGTEGTINYLDYLLERLNSSNLSSYKEIFSGWSKYIDISDEENITIERLRNTVKNSELWVKDEVEVLAKAIICDPQNLLYWQLLRTWIAKNLAENETIMGNILYCVSSQGVKETENALNYAVHHNLRSISLELVLKMLDAQIPDANIGAQKSLREMINKGWFSDDEYQDKSASILEKIKNNITLSNAEDVIWNSVCAATELAVATEQYSLFVELYNEYLSRSCAKQCCVLIADMILKNKMEGIEAYFKCLENALVDVPYKDLVTDIYNKAKIDKLNDAEKMTLVCIKKDYGNALGVNELLEFYCDMSVANNKKCGLDTIKLMIKYMTYDPVLYEVAACFLRDEKGLNENEAYYNYVYDYLESIQTDNPVEYAVGAMVCGENYLRLEGREVRSFRKIIEERYVNHLDLVKKYQEFCDCIIVSLRATEYEQFASILFRAVFSGDWLSVLNYNPRDNIINTVLKNNIKTDRINVADDYYRSVIKGVALFGIEHSNDMWEFLDNSERARMLWDNIGNVGCDFDYFTNSIQSVDDTSADELKRIWSLDIETLTVFKKYFGKSILKQPNCCNYTQVFNVFVNARSGDIFTNLEAQKYLKSIEKSTAILISENYEQLYLRASGPVALYSTGKNVIKDSDYEDNVFSNYLKRNTDDYYSKYKRQIRFKRKYELLSKMYNISSIQDANDNRFDLNEKKQIFSARSLYYYYSVLTNQVDEKVFRKKNSFAEIINAITVALSDDSYLTEINEFVSKFEDEIRTTLGVLILVEQNKLNKAAEIAIERFSGKNRSLLCAKMVAAYGKSGKNKDLCKKCREIAKKEGESFNYWIKNYKQCKAISRLDAAVYLADIEVKKETENTTMDETTDSRADEFGVAVYDEIKVDKTEEEIAEGIPPFIKNFVNSEYEDIQLRKYKKEWLKAKDALDNGSASEEALNEISINIGVCLIKRQSNKVDENIMRETFGLIRRYSIQDSYVVTALHDIFQKYISEYTDLDSLAGSVYENREELKHLCYEQDMNQKSRVSQDIEAATVLIEILTNIANDLSSAMGEEPIKERLKGYQDELFKRTKKISKFRNASNALGKMIQEKINSINYVPYLVISHLTMGNSDSNNWKEQWFEGAEKGFVRGVVLNRGGAPALKIALNVTVNSELRGEYVIEKIEPGRKIPFTVPYYRNDVTGSIVSWRADVSYYDQSNNIQHTSNAYGEIKVVFVQENWGLSHVGREKFNTQLSAEGEEFCGRTNELLKLENLYNTNTNPERYPSLLITGLRRAGKSSVIKYFGEKLRERKNLAPIYVDAQGIYGEISKAFFDLVFNELFRRYKNQMRDFVEFKKRWSETAKRPNWIGQLPSYFMELSELLAGRKVVFILDEMENVFYGNHFENDQQEEQFFGMIRSIIQNYQEYVSFIFCGSDKLLTSCLEQKRESQMFQVLQRIYVGRMNINDIRDMFEKYNRNYDIKFGDDAIDSIMYYTNGLIWYTKVIAYNILDRVIDQEHIVRAEIHPSDVNSIVELLIKGDLGAELIDLLDNNFGTKRKAIIRAMARASARPNESVNVDMISSELDKMDYVDNDTGEVLGNITIDELKKNLGVLEKMDFIVKDPRQEDSFFFSAELYRLLMMSDKKIDKFVKR